MRGTTEERLTHLELMLDSLTTAVEMLIKKQPPEPEEEKKVLPSAPKPNGKFKCQVCDSRCDHPYAQADVPITVLGDFDPEMQMRIPHNLLKRSYCCMEPVCIIRFHMFHKDAIKTL